MLLPANSSGFQFSVEPVLSPVAVAAASPVAVGAREPLSATGTEVGGGALPIADPASHVWTSSDPRVATVDSRTGVVTGRRQGR
ncbi:MAG TPA: Ig-like domain-containing protein [Pseudonocardiaceae bacterium]|nr:Ig-like domain-containing protein [Pseudonocardiaceae bacterium]